MLTLRLGADIWIVKDWESILYSFSFNGGGGEEKVATSFFEITLLSLFLDSFIRLYSAVLLAATALPAATRSHLL